MHKQRACFAPVLDFDGGLSAAWANGWLRHGGVPFVLGILYAMTYDMSRGSFETC
jgi:hypothetical protein